MKSGLLDDSLNKAMKNPVVKSVATMQSVATGKTIRNLMKNKKGKMFVLVCHFCGVRVTYDQDALV